jgi:hypothetical protein
MSDNIIDITRMKHVEKQDITLQGMTYTIYAYRYDGHGKFTYLYIDESGTPSVIVLDKIMNLVSFHKLAVAVAAPDPVPAK